jgi:hypothetical protein
MGRYVSIKTAYESRLNALRASAFLHIHPAHSAGAHAAMGMLFVLRSLGNHYLGRQQQARDGCGILQRKPRGVDDRNSPLRTTAPTRMRVRISPRPRHYAIGQLEAAQDLHQIVNLAPGGGAARFKVLLHTQTSIESQDHTG